MRNITLLITMILLMVTSLAAADRQFYFIGKKGRLGSISSLEKQKSGIYLRWDLIEGDMPSDIATIELIRVAGDGNTTLLDVKSDAVMDDGNISAIAQESASQRRTFELITSIDKSDDATCSGANIANLAPTLRSCLQNNYWSFLASRVDFDVARARYRAYLDTEYDPTATTVRYVLLAKNSDATQSFVLGSIDVDTTQEYPVLAVKDLQQIISSSCNDNRYALDDARVSLFWRNGGENTTENFANSLMVSGYDIYYSTVPSESFDVVYKAANIDIAKLASEISHDANGNVDLSAYHLAKANETLVTVDKNDANNTQPIYMETKESLKERGFIPGENRYYFVVPRDFTGNYGKTAFVKVTIPDLLPPVAPINPRVIESNGKAELIWDAVTFQNYAHHHQYDMKACTTQTLTPKSRVTFVAKNQICGNNKGVELNFNVDKYYVYRFESAKEAAGFEDLDLDGYNDADENATQKCSAQIPLGATNYLVATLSANTQGSVHFRDETLQESKVYWYRIVSATINGVTSQLTAPIRAFIPKRAVYKAPDVNVTYNVMRITTPIKERADMVFLEDRMGLGSAYGINRVQLVIQGKGYDFPLDNTQLELSEDVKNIVFLPNQTSQSATILFMKTNDIVFARNFNLNTFFNFRSQKDDTNGDLYYIQDAKRMFLVQKEVKVFHDGDVVEDGCVDVTFNEGFLDGLAGNGCIETTLAIGNDRYKRDKDCNITSTKQICEQSLNGDLVSVGLRKVMYNGLYSLSTNINFVPLNLPAPHKPSIKAFVLDKTGRKAAVGILPQVEKVTGTLLKIYKEDNKSRSFIKTVTHLGEHDFNTTINTTFENLGPLDDNDVWCVQGKTIGLDGQMSPWSSLVCKKVTPQESELDLLGWPKLGEVTQSAYVLPVEFDQETQTVRILINQVDVQTELQPKIETQEYAQRIAKDLFGASKKLIIKLIKGEDILEELEIAKSGDGNYYLPGKLSSINSQEDAKRITSVILNFITAEGKDLFDRSIELKGENVLQYSEQSVIVINQYVRFVNVVISSAKTLVETVNKLNKHYNFLIYRQTIDSDGHKGNFVQVTPLIEAAGYDETTQTTDISNNIVVSDEGNTRSIYLVDKYPYIVGQSYKYVIMFFDKVSGEPVSYALTSPQQIDID